MNVRELIEILESIENKDLQVFVYNETGLIDKNDIVPMDLVDDSLTDRVDLNIQEKIMYKPEFLSWCKSYEQEVEELEYLISCEPVDADLLKDEYESLTGEEYEQN